MGKRKEITSKDNGKQKMWIIITVIIVFFAMAGYAGMSYYYSDRFFRGTTINGINCSGKTSEEAEQAVAKKAEDYLLEVKARNLKSQSINGKLIGYRYVSDGSISQYLDEQKPYKWVRGFWKKQNYTAKENMTYDKVKLKKQLEKLECVKKENQTAPEDAYVAYKDSKFEIVPETEGNTMDFNGAYQALSEAVTDKKRTIDLNSCPAVYVKAAVLKDDPDLKNSLEECQNLIRTKIVYIFGEETVTLEGDEIRKGSFIVADERKTIEFVDVTAKSEPHENKAEELVLFLERYYQSGLSEQEIRKAVNLTAMLVKEKAEKLGARLVLSSSYKNVLENKNYVLTNFYMYISASKNGSQYLDSLGGAAGVSASGSYTCNTFLLEAEERREESL